MSNADADDNDNDDNTEEDNNTDNSKKKNNNDNNDGNIDYQSPNNIPNAKPVKKTQNHKQEKRLELHEFCQKTLGSGNLREAVRLPKGEDFNEWLAVNSVDFFNEISLLYGCVSEYCTDKSCAIMSAGPKYEYLWMDGVKYTKPHKCSAPEYIDLLMTWVEDQINDPAIFPIEDAKPFPNNFRSIVKTILKRLFRVYAHIYYSHFSKIVSLGEEPHLNTCFKHFYYFITEFQLVPTSEMNPLQDLINNLTNEEENPSPQEEKKD